MTDDLNKLQIGQTRLPLESPLVLIAHNSRYMQASRLQSCFRENFWRKKVMQNPRVQLSHTHITHLSDMGTNQLSIRKAINHPLLPLARSLDSSCHRGENRNFASTRIVKFGAVVCLRLRDSTNPEPDHSKHVPSSSPHGVLC